jgi:hypothetical protein
LSSKDAEAYVVKAEEVVEEEESKPKKGRFFKFWGRKTKSKYNPK